VPVSLDEATAWVQAALRDEVASAGGLLSIAFIREWEHGWLFLCLPAGAESTTRSPYIVDRRDGAVYRASSVIGSERAVEIILAGPTAVASSRRVFRVGFIGGIFPMSAIEETIEATLDSNGQLHLSHQPQLPAGPVRVTIRVAVATRRRGLADVIREIAAEQRARGFPGRSEAEVLAEDNAAINEDAERDRELDTARRGNSAGGP
jgi:hypothetical protein